MKIALTIAALTALAGTLATSDASTVVETTPAEAIAAAPEQPPASTPAAPAALPADEPTELRILDTKDLLDALQVSPDHPSTDIFILLNNITGATAYAMGANTVAVVGTRPQLDAIDRVIASITSSPMLELEIMVHDSGPGTAPRLGEPAPSPEPSFRLRRAMRQGTTATLDTIAKVGFISDWTPVVSTGSVGYDPQIEELEEGLRLAATVTPSPDASGSRVLRLQGSITSLTLTSTTTRLPGGPEQGLAISLPRRESTAIATSIALPEGRPIVVAVLPGKSPGTSVVLSASVRALSAPSPR
jgi:hypothetical protein